ncbi:MAG: hypothetical protein AB1410_06915 [Acidobacteriota bacterium]
MIDLNSFLKNNWKSGLLIMVIVFAIPVAMGTQEHPGAKRLGLTKESLTTAIKDYVQKDTELKGGFFLFYDNLSKKPLMLTLVKVHDDRLSMVKKGLYFACADFKTPDNHSYDLDIFMEDTERGLEVREITIHKEDGKARYRWEEEKGIWIRKQK